MPTQEDFKREFLGYWDGEPAPSPFDKFYKKEPDLADLENEIIELRKEISELRYLLTGTNSSIIISGKMAIDEYKQILSKRNLNV